VPVALGDQALNSREVLVFSVRIRHVREER
jgi:hypothetical protein